MEGMSDCHCPCGANDVQQPKGVQIDATHTNLWVVPHVCAPDLIPLTRNKKVCFAYHPVETLSVVRKGSCILAVVFG